MVWASRTLHRVERRGDDLSIILHLRVGTDVVLARLDCLWFLSFMWTKIIASTREMISGDDGKVSCAGLLPR